MERTEYMSSYKRNGVTVTMPDGFYGTSKVTAAPYQYPKGHPCHGCPYTLNTTVPSCMFPARRDGGCFWYDQKRKTRPPLPALPDERAAERIFAFIEVLKAVKRRKGFQ